MLDPSTIRRYLNTTTFQGTMGFVFLGLILIAVAFVLHRIGCRSCGIWLGLAGTLVALSAVLQSMRVTNDRR